MFSSKVNLIMHWEILIELSGGDIRLRLSIMVACLCRAHMAARKRSQQESSLGWERQHRIVAP
jgi:hypothetical protein